MQQTNKTFFQNQYKEFEKSLQNQWFFKNS
jgi:hypothetical protein